MLRHTASAVRSNWEPYAIGEVKCRLNLFTVPCLNSLRIDQRSNGDLSTTRSVNDTDHAEQLNMEIGISETVRCPSSVRSPFLS